MLNINNKPCKNCGNKTTVTAKVAEVQKTIPTQKISQRIENPDCEGVTVHCNDPWLKIVVRDAAGVVVKLINLPHSEAVVTYNAFVEANPNATYTVTFYQCCNDINAPTCVDCATNDECPEGTTCVNGTCLDPDSLCEDGQIVVAGNCYDTPIDGECANNTAPVTLWDGTVICVADGECPEGTVNIEGICYLTAETESECPSGTTFVNGVCYLTATNGVCPPNTTNVNGVCYHSAVNGVCPNGTTNVNGVCYTNADNGVCPPNTTNVNGVCYPSAVNGVCPPNTTNVNGVCVITNIGGCPDGTTNVNGVCYPNSNQGSCDTGTPVTLWDGTVICLANGDCPDGTTNVNGVCYLTPVDGECAEGYEPMILECNVIVCLPLPTDGACPGDLVFYNGHCYIPYECPNVDLRVITTASTCTNNVQTVTYTVINQGPSDIINGTIELGWKVTPINQVVTVVSASQGVVVGNDVNNVTLLVNSGGLDVEVTYPNESCVATNVSCSAEAINYTETDWDNNNTPISYP